MRIVKINKLFKNNIYDKIRYHNFNFFPYLLIKDSISNKINKKESIRQCN